MAQAVSQGVRPGAESYKIFESFQPLQTREIRLIHLQPGGLLNTNPLSCKIVHQSLDGTTQFEALSYCWGNTKPTGKIVCDGQAFEITDSLETAFRRIRHRDRTRLIWADFLCIKQTDDAEKASQVRMMTDIYRKASNVVAWVGESRPEDEEAMKIDKLAARLKGTEYPDPEAWRTMIAFTNFFQRPWFGRIWIIQELGVANKLTLCCGKREMDWQVFRRGVSLLLDNFGFYLNTSGTDVALERVLTMISIRNLVTEHVGEQQQALGVFRQLRVDRIDNNRNKKVVQPGDLLRFARSSRLFGAFDPHDRIYALLGLVQPSESQSMNIQYDLNCPQVFQDFALAMISQTGSLDILCQAGLHENDLPSWVPDWTRRLDAHSLNVDVYAADRRAARLPETTELDVLQVTGYILDTIAELCTGFSSNISKQISQPNAEESTSQAVWKPGKAQTDNPEVFEKTITGTLGVVLPLAESFANPLKAPVRIVEMIGGAVRGIQGAREPRTLRIKPEMEQAWHNCAKDCSRYSNPEEAYQNTLLGGIPVTSFAPLMSTAHRDICYRIWRERLFENPLVNRGFTRWSSTGSGPKVEVPKELKKMYVKSEGDSVERGQRSQDAKQFIARAYSRAVDRIALNRQFCSTQSGWMGWVPCKAKVGDIVCILEGGKVPFVLRKSKKNGEYCLIGEAYIHGVMMGEAALDGKKVGQSFRLR